MGGVRGRPGLMEEKRFGRVGLLRMMSFGSGVLLLVPCYFHGGGVLLLGLCEDSFSRCKGCREMWHVKCLYV